MDVMDLMAKIGLDDSEYNKKLDSDGSKFEGFGSKLASGAKSVAKAGVAAFAAIGTAIGGATTALVANAKETAAYADQIDKESQKLGISAEAYQEWDAILQHTGGSVDNLKPALKTLSKEIMNNSEAFQELGFSQEEIKNASVEDVLSQTISKLQEMPNGIEKTRLATQLLGKSSVELGALLNLSSEETEQLRQNVHDLGGVMSDEAVKAGAAFQDSLQDLKTTLTGAKNNLMAEFLPSLTTVMDGLTAIFSGDDSGIGKIKQGIEDFAGKLNERLPKVLETVGSIAESLISALPSFFDTIAQQLPSLISTLLPVLINAVVSLSDAIVSALPQIMQAIQSNISVITNGLKKIFTALGKIILQLAPTLLPILLKIGTQLIVELARGFSENASEVIATIIELINMVVEELTNPETLMTILECGIQILTAIVNGIAENLPLLLETMGTLIVNITTFLVQAIPELVVAIGKNGATIITDVIPNILTSLGTALGDLLFFILNDEGIGGWLSDIIGKATEIFEGIGQGILDAWDFIWKKLGTIGEWILDKIESALSGIYDIGKNLIEGLWNGIESMGSWIKNKVEGIGSSILGGIKSVFGIASPSKVFKNEVGRQLALGLGLGFEEEAKNTFDNIQRSLNKSVDALQLEPINISSVASIRAARTGNSTIDLQSSMVDKLVQAIYDYLNGDHEEIYQLIFGGRQLDEFVLTSKNRLQLRSGGQVNV